MISNEVKNLLKLDKNERKIITALQKDPLNVAGVSRESRLPRMTAHETIQRLVARGLVAKEKNGVRRLFKLNTKKLHLLEFVTTNKNNLGEFIFGKENMFSMWQEIENLPAQTRIYGVQPTASMKETLQKLDWDERVTKVQGVIAKKPIIIEGLLAEDYYPFILSYYKNKDEDLAKRALESFVSRATDMVFVSSDMLRVSSELYILPHAAYILSWADEAMLKIENVKMVELMKEFFDLARGHGKKIDQNAYIRNLLKNFHEE